MGEETPRICPAKWWRFLWAEWRHRLPVPNQRGQHPLDTPQRQAVHLLEGKRALDRHIRAGLGRPSFAGLFLHKPLADGVIVEPEGQTATVDQGGVVLLPVADAVSMFGRGSVHAS